MIRRIFLAMTATLLSVTGLFAQIQELPDDPAVRKGVLSNGLTYYIRHNDKPANLAEFWIFDNVGALQEEDSQQGLAHFLEHMAFNGTQNYPGKGLINYLESIGVKFGSNLNAFTAQEMTCYNMSNVPVSREGVIDSALLILHDWAYYIALEGDEIDNERGVIVEEMRTRNSASWRMNTRTQPYLYGNNRYSTRNVIGYEEGLRTFEHKELRDFYHRWYRTDMQAIIVVGDIDVDKMEKKIVELFSSIPAVENPEPKAVITMEPNDEPIIAVLTDPELTSSDVTLYVKREPIPMEFNKTPQAVLISILDVFMANIANERLSDIAREPNAPFLSAYAYNGGSAASIVDMIAFGATAREGEIERAFSAIYTEYEKMRRYGVTESEFERTKTELQRQIQQAYDGRDDRKHSDFMWTYIENYRQNGPMMSAEDEYQLYSMLLQNINVDLLNQFIQQERMTVNNQVVIATLPEKQGIAVPTEEALLNTMITVLSSEIEAATDNFVAEPLIPAKTKLKGSKVVSTQTDKFGATIWTLKNGVRVVVLPTDFKNDEVLIQIHSKGGMSVLNLEEIKAVDILPAYMASAGLGKFNNSELRKQLAGKVVNMNPSIGSYSNGFYGSASPKDLETMMQIIYLYFTSPRYSQQDFDVVMDNFRNAYLNIGSDPQFKFQQAFLDALYDNNPRRNVLDFDELDAIKFEHLQSAYSKLYGNPDDFTYMIVGNVDLKTLRPLVEKYLGSLPSTKQEYASVDDGVRMFRGVHNKSFSTSMEMPKCRVATVLTGDMEYNLESVIAMDVFSQLLTINYLNTMREEKGGTYGVSAQGEMAFEPENRYAFLTMFDTDPALVDDLKKDIVNEIRIIAENGVKADDLNKIKEFFAKQHPADVKQNSYWRGILNSYYVYGYDLDENYMEIVNGFTPEYFQQLANKILNDGNVLQLIMYPEVAE